MIRCKIKTSALLIRWLCLIAALLQAVPVSAQRRDFVPFGRYTVTKANGSTARFSTLTKACDSLTGGERLNIGPGTTAVPAAIEIDVPCEIVGSGWATILDGPDIFTITSDDVELRNFATKGQITFTGAEDCTVTDCHFNADGEASAIDVLALSHFTTFNNCWVVGGATRGAYHHQVNGTKWIGCTIAHNTQVGLYFDWDSGAAQGLKGCGAAGNDEAKYHPPLVTGCHIIQNGTIGLFGIYCHDICITGCNIERNAETGVYISRPIQPVIVGNEFERNGPETQTSTNAQVVFLLGTTNSEFAYSTGQIQNNHFGQYMQGIRIAGAAATPYNIAITGNTFQGALGNSGVPSRAIWVQEYDAAYNIAIQDNLIHGSPVAGAANQSGIRCDNSNTDTDATSLMISGNTICGDNLAGITVARLDGASVVGNKIVGATTAISNVSSAGTIVQGNVCDGNSAAIADSGTSPSYIARGNKGIDDNVNVGRETRDYAGGSFSPADATVYYFANTQNVPTATTGVRRCYVPSACRITKAYVFFAQVAGSNEQSTLAVRVNDTTDTNISTVITNDATGTAFNSTSLNITLAAGDFFNFKWTTPTWGTNPTSCTPTVVLEFEPIN